MKKIVSIIILCFWSFSSVALTDLALCLDYSLSVGGFNIKLQRDGTAKAIEDSVPRDGSVRISVYTFAGKSKTEIQPTIITNANYKDIIEKIEKLSLSGRLGGTNMSACINDATQEMTTAAPKSTRKIIDISTDGIPVSNMNIQEAVKKAKTAGVNELNALLIGKDAKVDKMKDVVFPQPSGGKNGFIVKIDDYLAYEKAIKNKIKTELSIPNPNPNPNPNPGSSTIASVPGLNSLNLLVLSGLLTLLSLTLCRFWKNK